MPDKQAAQIILEAKIPAHESEQILCHIFKLSQSDFFLVKKDLALSKIKEKVFKKFEEKILSGYPLQYLLKRASFYGHDFYVNKNVLIPRPETELLVERAIEFVKLKIYKDNKVKTFKLADIGTGSGCITISLANELKKKSTLDSSLFTFFATDISPAALRIARKNARRHKIKINFLRSDLFTNPQLPEKFDLILANLPYLPENFATENPALTFEPTRALNGGQDGLEIIKRLISQLEAKLTQSGMAILEIDPRQKNALKKTAQNTKLKFEFISDLNDRTRFIKFSSP